MMLGAINNEPQKNIGEAEALQARVDKLEKEVKFMRWAMIFLVIYIIWKDNMFYNGFDSRIYYISVNTRSTEMS